MCVCGGGGGMTDHSAEIRSLFNYKQIRLTAPEDQLKPPKSMTSRTNIFCDFSVFIHIFLL